MKVYINNPSRLEECKNFITEIEHQTIIAIEKGIENEK